MALAAGSPSLGLRDPGRISLRDAPRAHPLASDALSSGASRHEGECPTDRKKELHEGECAGGDPAPGPALETRQGRAMPVPPPLSYTPPVDRIVLLENPIRHYAWGSRTFLARLQGRPFPTREPEAELWIGAHPAAPSRVVTEAGTVPLPEWIARDPEGILGPEVAARFGGELPFLVKILAVEQPLSVQVHPDAAQARAGFEREEAAGIPRDAPHRSYRDPRPKPELVRALTPFEALVGLRPAGEVRRELAALEIPALRPILEALEGFAGGSTGEGDALRRAFATLLAWPAAERPALVAAVAEAARRRGGEPGQGGEAWEAAGGRLDSGGLDQAGGHRAAGSRPLGWAVRLAEAWPADPLVLAPLFLHHVRLAPGETLFVGSGTLHAYLSGAAVEVQASSDNVLRAGLTGKHVDVEELLRVARVEARDPVIGDRDGYASATTGHLGAECDTWGDELRPVAAHVQQARISRRGGRVEILVCVEGRVEVGHHGEGVVLGPGAGCLIPADLGPHELTGHGRLLGAASPKNI